MSWLERTSQRQSKGQRARKATSLGDLHRRRAETQAQFWTPSWVASGIWASLAPAMQKVPENRLIKVLDPAVGSGRLFTPAPLDRCSFYGLDIDQDCIQALSEETRGSEASYEFAVGAMEDLTARNFDICVMNPPFGLHLAGPNMRPYACTSFGPFGPNTAATSHEYALMLALDAAQLVAAVMPSSADGHCRSEERLAAVYRLPRNTFKAEGANVATSVYVFGPPGFSGPVEEFSVCPGEEWPAPAVAFKQGAGDRRVVFRLNGIDFSEPTISTPVTGDPTVRIDHHNRRIVLNFHCGLTEAKVLNALLREDVPREGRHRYPKEIRYRGDGHFYLDTYLLQEDPDAALNAFIEQIRQQGGAPAVSPTFTGYWSKLKKRHHRAMEPFRHWVKMDQGDSLVLEATRSTLLEPGNPRSPAIRRGTQLKAVPLGGEYIVEYEGHTVQQRRDVLEKRFTFIGGSELARDKEWRLVHPGLEAKFPEIAKAYRAQIAKLGIDQWLWPYQIDSLVELLMKPCGSVAGWQQGTGKARLAIALGLVSGKALLCVEPGLLPEMRRELIKLQIDPSLYQVIEGVDDTRVLKRLNLVSYHRLRSVDDRDRMLAAGLRRRVTTVIADEGSLLRNPGSLQSRAVARLSPRRLYVLDGTPVANYPRDLLPIAGATAGDGVANQPFSLRQRPFMSPALLRSASFVARGIDEFRDRHVCIDWAVNEFKDDLRTGAKRELPRINDVLGFRDWAGRFVQRRLRDEPEVAPFAGCPKPIYEDHEIGWDKAHFKYYLKHAIEFAQWYRNHKAECGSSGKGLNLVAILARIRAVMSAANNPHAPGRNSLGTYVPVTSKQRAVMERIAEHVAAGRKTIVYMESPEMVRRLQRELQENYGIDAVPFHGQRPIEERTAEMDERFRFGDCMVMLCSWCAQRGLNLACAKAVVFYQRNWSGDVEQQAIARTQRPDQDSRVWVDRFHLAGSLDVYMKQLVEWKVAAADAGLDWGDGATEDDVFMHMDALIEEFCEETLGMRAREAYEKMLAA